MNKKFFLIITSIIFILLAIFFIFKENRIYLKEITYSEYKNKINNKESFIIYFKQNGCSHCASFTPVFEKVLNDYKVTAYFINFSNLSDEDNKSLSNDITISGTPTVVFIKDGKELSGLYRIEGEKERDIIINKLIKTGYIGK